MSARTRNALRVMMLISWLVLALLMVQTTLAQDGSGTTAPSDGETIVTVPENLDETATRMLPLLVGAALIERTIELIFTWVERAILDASHYLNTLALRFTGLVQVNLRNTWKQIAKLSDLVLQKKAAGADPLAGNSDSSNPADWPLAMLEARMIEANNTLSTAEDMLEKALQSPEYTARKKITAAWISIGMGIVLAFMADLRLFELMGVTLSGWIEETGWVDKVLAGIVMGLGTEWVHQLIGILVKGKGLLGRAGSGTDGETQIDQEQIRMLAELAVNQELQAQTGKLRQELTNRVESITTPMQSSGIITAAYAAADTTIDPDPVPVTAASVASPAPAASPGTALPAGTLRLYNTTVTVRTGGVNVRAEPDITSAKKDGLSAGARVPVNGLLWNAYSWLHMPEDTWIAGQFTDFARSDAYNQVTHAWYESGAVLDFRRGLMRDLLRVRRMDSEQIAAVDTLSGADLAELENTVTRQTMPPQYMELWQMQERLGLPDPFDVLPVQPSPPLGINEVEFNGFGPNTFSHANWYVYYENTRGMHNGVDFIVEEGAPLIAVSDGVIVDFRFLGNSAESSLALRPYLPDHIRKADGSRVLSNLIVAYGHLTGNPTSFIVRIGDEVQAGDIIGNSGWPVYTLEDGSTGIQYNNAHLHLETHFVTNGEKSLGSGLPFNPLLFWTPRLIAWQARLAGHSSSAPYPTSGQPYGRLGFFSIGAYSYTPRRPLVWEYEPTRTAPWPEGVYDLPGMIKLLGTFAPYQPA